jgi:cytidylate kinase
VAERENISLTEVIKVESERLKSIILRYKKLYGIQDFQDDKYFDLIVDTTENNPEDVIKIIKDFILKK